MLEQDREPRYKALKHFLRGETIPDQSLLTQQWVQHAISCKLIDDLIYRDPNKEDYKIFVPPSP